MGQCLLCEGCPGTHRQQWSAHGGPHVWHMPHAAERLTLHVVCGRLERVPKTKKWAEAGKCCAYCGSKADVHCHDAKQCQARDPQGFPGAAATTRVLHELLGGGGHGQQPFVDLLDFWWRGQPLQYTYRVGFRLPLTLFSHSGVTDGRLNCGKQKKTKHKV